MTTSYVYQLDGTIVPIARSAPIAESPSQASKAPFIPVFRKMTNCKVELQIAKIIKDNPCPNIVKIYDVTPTYYTMEILETNYILNASIIEKMQIAKTYMQSNNIA